MWTTYRSRDLSKNWVNEWNTLKTKLDFLIGLKVSPVPCYLSWVCKGVLKLIACSEGKLTVYFFCLLHLVLRFYCSWYNHWTNDLFFFFNMYFFLKYINNYPIQFTNFRNHLNHLKTDKINQFLSWSILININ